MKVHMVIFKFSECDSGLQNETCRFHKLEKKITRLDGWHMDLTKSLFSLISGAKNTICSSRNFVVVSFSFLSTKSNCVLISKHILTCSLTSFFIFSLVISGHWFRVNINKNRKKNPWVWKTSISTMLNQLIVVFISNIGSHIHWITFIIPLTFQWMVFLLIAKRMAKMHQWLIKMKNTSNSTSISDLYSSSYQ